MSKFIERRNQGGGGGSGSGGNTYIDLPIDGGVKNGNVGANIINSFPFIEFFLRPSGFGSLSYNFSVPSNFADGYSLPLTLFWSATDNDIGNVNWVVEYNSFTPFTSNILSPVNSIGINQTTVGDNSLIISTGTSLVIPPITANSSIIFINVRRVFDGSDTYNNSVRLHLVRLQYTQKIITS